MCPLENKRANATFQCSRYQSPRLDRGNESAGSEIGVSTAITSDYRYAKKKRNEEERYRRTRGRKGDTGMRV